MLSFNEWVKNQVNIQQINTIYDKAHISVDIVNQYNPDLLSRISTIANLATGVYGMYTSAEAQKQIPPVTERWLLTKGIKKDQINKVPEMMLKSWGMDTSKIKIGDTIHVNVRKILSQSKSNLDAVLQIASTIIHECIHEKEREFTGKTSEVGPKAEEQKFSQWVHQNLNKILRQYPELNRA